MKNVILSLLAISSVAAFAQVQDPGKSGGTVDGGRSIQQPPIAGDVLACRGLRNISAEKKHPVIQTCIAAKAGPLNLVMASDYSEVIRERSLFVTCRTAGEFGYTTMQYDFVQLGQFYSGTNAPVALAIDGNYTFTLNGGSAAITAANPVSAQNSGDLAVRPLECSSDVETVKGWKSPNDPI